MDLLDLLGGEWATPDPVASDAGDEQEGSEPDPAVATGRCSHPYDERVSVTHGCPESGRAPLEWNDVAGTYIDGMGRATRCSYCPSCVGTGRTVLRDPWTDELVAGGHAVAPCVLCFGTGYLRHAWDCGPDRDHAHLTPRPQAQIVPAFGITVDRRTFVAGERSPWADLQARSAVEAVRELKEEAR